MRLRNLGKNGPEVSVLGLGCMPMSGIYGAADDEESRAVIRAAVEAGVTMLDTADMYGSGHNEELIASALKDVSAKTCVATKFGYQETPEGDWRINGRPDYARAACEASLRRLGTDVIDLYYLHRVDPDVPIEESVGAMADLVREGKVRALGLSEASVKTIERARTEHEIVALQSEYSLWTRDVEDEILPYLKEHGIGFVAYSPLGRGFLTGKHSGTESLDKDDFRRSNPRWQGDNLDHNLVLVERVREIAGEKGVTPAQLAIAWVVSRGDNIVPIPGTRRRKYLDENRAAASVELSAQDLARIEEVLPREAVRGERQPPEGMAQLDT